ncbi:hypothetical protein H072_2779 [Dactylellina haptotyla CBS 200.50]|uniref:Centromere protein X n=1 Tax=Dactylellina haptotyla (strain CBS 200.50) TaxID=1284197 RepID=S8AJY0_DACHA|nr:hypothetical protein H072_2779 [Dactylellina haptotyla CBS 200.50]
MPPKKPSKANEEASSNRRPHEPADSAGDKDNSEREERKATIPPELLAKLLKNFIEDEGTKISGAAIKTVGEYMHLFLTEAVYRAVSNRRDGDPWAKTNAGLMLEVEDLEKITPQLLLDF